MVGKLGTWWLKTRRRGAIVLLILATAGATLSVATSQAGAAPRERSPNIQRESGERKKATARPPKGARFAAKSRAARKATAPDDSISLDDLARLVVSAVILGLFIRWRRQTREETTRVHPSDAKPATRLVDLNDDDPRSIAAEIELLTRPDSAGVTPTPPADDREKAATKPLLALPGELSQHFTGWAGERLLWHTALGARGDEGTIAITDRRLLAIHKSRSLTVLPPSFAAQIRRHQDPIGSLVGARPVRSHVPSLLALAAGAVAWFPLGTMFACAAIGLFLAYTRGELEIATLTSRRRYPIPPREYEAARRAILTSRAITVEAGNGTQATG